MGESEGRMSGEGAGAAGVEERMAEGPEPALEEAQAPERHRLQSQASTGHRPCQLRPFLGQHSRCRCYR